MRKFLAVPENISKLGPDSNAQEMIRAMQTVLEFMAMTEPNGDHRASALKAVERVRQMGVLESLTLQTELDTLRESIGLVNVLLSETTRMLVAEGAFAVPSVQECMEYNNARKERMKAGV